VVERRGASEEVVGADARGVVTVVVGTTPRVHRPALQLKGYVCRAPSDPCVLEAPISFGIFIPAPFPAADAFRHMRPERNF
jgi:hypothetical protein